MHRLRAEEIAQSPEMKNVTYQGRQVYIQQVNDQSETARVYPIDEPSNEFDAQLSSLMENQ
ncbi:H-type small acid-soluble spore protein [Ornithinibacillus halophilus]|uniref:Small, acid-soluble spore protein H n=1 Tax=Ornithinibacillus halophilus TaxID=930117 RepID=A0A1M5KD33_9BACI|nr:H-type small acid-soluble spore protein [Ornithinibacillus halophilus]SHG50540.1 small acid-soluble spore protein H (minor) [Ornithinibacillus halophilus]